MDTNELPPAEASDVNAPEDTGTDIAQPEETGEASAAEPEESGEEASALLAGKYKSPEELEKAYKELEGKLGQRDETLGLVKDLERTTGMNAFQIKQALAQQEQAKLEQQYQDNPVPYLAQEVMQLRQERLIEKQEQELNNFLNSDEGKPYQDLRNEILEDKQYNPRFQNLPFADIARERYGKVRAQGQQDAYRKIETKRMTQATNASQAAPKSRVTLEDLDKMTVAEMEAVLPWADISNRP